MARKDRKDGSPEPASGEMKKSPTSAEGAAVHVPAKPLSSHVVKTEPKRFLNMNDQLASLGLKLRVVLGDGNCLFRALGDQIDGHTRKHLDYRHRTVQYMREHRDFFEPFIEDTTTFDRHVALLGECGTHAGNDALVAFAGSYEAIVVVHQLNTPLYHIASHGHDKSRSPLRELHVAYHSGDHYDSIRKLDEPEIWEYPAMIHIPTITKNPSPKPHLQSVHVKPPLPSIWSDHGSGRRIFGDETAEMALMLPASSCASDVVRMCERKRRKSGLDTDTRPAAELKDVRPNLDCLAWSSSYSSR